MYKNEHKRLATFVVLEPDTVDRNGDAISAEEIQKTAAEFFFNNKNKAVNTNHRAGSDRIDALFVGSIITPEDLTLSDGTSIAAGSWLVQIQFLSRATWQKVLDGQITGVSMEGIGRIL